MSEEHKTKTIGIEQDKLQSQIEELIQQAASELASANYHKSLELYQRILELDPANQLALEASNQIKTLKIADMGSVRDLLTLIAESAQSLLAADSVAIYAYSTVRGEEKPQIVTTGEWKDPQEIFGTSATSLRNEVLATDDLYIVEDIKQHPSFVQDSLPKREGLQSFIGIPLKAGNKTVGVLFVNYRNHHRFAESTLRLCKVFASQAAIAIENTALFDRLQRSNTELVLAYTNVIEGWSQALDLRDKGIQRSNIERAQLYDVTNEGWLQYLNLRDKEIILERQEYDPARQLTPDYLTNVVTPYLKAIADIQHIINELQERKPTEIVVKMVRQYSPISVSLDGASEAIQQIKDTVVPWRREHIKAISQLLEQEKQVDIEVKKAEILEKRARAQKDREEAQRLASEVFKQHEETERLRLENEKLRLELQKAKIQLALDMLEQLAPNLSETERYG